MADIHAPLTEGDAITIRFDEAIVLSGVVAWGEPGRIGVKFREPLDVSALLIQLSKQAKGENRYRSPRLKIQLQAEFLFHSMSYPIHVEDISQRGLKAATTSVSEGDEGAIVLPGILPKRAVVRWVKDGMAGFFFLDPIGFSELGQWVLNLRQWNRIEHSLAP